MSKFIIIDGNSEIINIEQLQRIYKSNDKFTNYNVTIRESYEIKFEYPERAVVLKYETEKRRDEVFLSIIRQLKSN